MITIQKLDALISDFDLRLDYKYYSLVVGNFIYVGKTKNQEYIKLKDILLPRYRNFIYQPDTEYKGVSTTNENFDEIGNIVDFDLVTIDEHPDRLKYKVKKDYLLLSSLKGAKCPPFLISDEWENAVFSNGFYIYEIAEGYHPVFIKYLLQSSYFRSILDEHIYRGIGISTFKERDFLDIRIPQVSYEAQKRVVEQIKPIENQIEPLIKGKVKLVEVVNRVLGKRFGFDAENLSSRKRTLFYQHGLVQNTKSFDLRTSHKFHNPAFFEVDEILQKIGCKKIKYCLAKDIRLGAGVSPSDTDNNGNAYFISPAAMSRGYVSLSEAWVVSQDYFQKNKKRFAVKQGDILLRRSGMSIGKVAIVQDEMDAVYSDFMMRIQFNPNLAHPKFVYYFFNSILFQSLIERDKKGLQLPNIFPSQIKDFPIPDISISQQIAIADEIQAEMDIQNSGITEILKKRKEIEKQVLNAIGISKQGRW